MSYVLIVVAGKRWHFENCLKNPFLSPTTIQEREKLSQKTSLMNRLQLRKKK